MPDWKPEIRKQLAGLHQSPTCEAAIVEELAQDLNDCYDTLLAGGISEAEAYQQTLAELSDSDLLMRELRCEAGKQEPIIFGTNRRTNMIADLWQDLRFGARMLVKQPGFTLIAVLTLTLGIGANTAIFSVVNAVLLRPLPYAEAEQLVGLGGWARKNKDKEAGVTPADFLDYREQSQSFSHLAASISEGVPMNLSGTGEPERITGALVTANYLDVFGVRPLLGRTFVAEEGQDGRDLVVVLSHGYWERRFGADPAILNQTITLDGRKLTIIGVMPPQFQYPAGVALWKPFSFSESPQSPMRSRRFYMLRPVGRLKPGVTLAQAQAEVETIARRLETQYPQTNTDWSLWLTPLQERLVGDIKLTLLLLFGAVACVLLIACANVANLLLARATTRQKEIAVRAALGASRNRIVRQLLVESLLLSLLGGAGGVLLAQWGVRLLVRLGAGYIPRAEEIHLNAPVFVFTLTISLLTGLLFGLVPAWRATRLELTDALKDSSKGSGGQRHRTLHALVVSEMALAVVLLVCAGLLINSFVRLQQVRPGFDETNLLTLRLDLPNPYAQPEQKTQFFDQLQQRIAALPGVEAVGTVTELPLTRSSADMPFQIIGRTEGNDGQKNNGDIRNINHAYFQAMRLPLLKGRNVTEAEVRANAKVVVISELLAQRFFPGAEPLGQQLLLESLSKEPYEIIGIVGDVRHRGLAGEPRQTMYFPSLRLGYAHLVIRTASDPTSLTAAVRQEVMAINPQQPVSQVKTMDQWVTDSVAQPRFRTLLLGLFAGVALLLSIVGIYGVLSYAVTERRQELGIRLALGATAQDVLKLVMRQGMTLAWLGIGIGLVAAFGVTRLLQGLVYGVSVTDPLTFAAIALLLAGVALLACWLPARRATKVDPLVVLRSE